MIRYNDLSLSYLESNPGGVARAGDPIVILIHGRGADASDLAPLAAQIGGDLPCRFVLPDAPRRFQPTPELVFGYTWFDGYPPDPRSLQPSVEILSRFIDEIAERTGTRPGDMILCGFSQGALMTLAVGLRRTPPFAALVALSGGIDRANLPPEAIASSPPVLMIHGRRDEAIPIDLARRTRSILQDSGIEPEYHELDIGHEISQPELGLIKTFVTRHLSRRSPDPEKI